MTRTRLIAPALAYAGLSVLSRRWHRRWGATRHEAVETLPGDELVPRADLQTTRTIDIEAAAPAVWPWLVQMGQGRGGLDTYERIENLLGAKIHNLDRFDLDLQQLDVGDHIRLTPEVYLRRIPGQSLIVRGRRSAPASVAEGMARQLELLVLEPGYFVMERGMLRGIKTRAERVNQ